MPKVSGPPGQFSRTTLAEVHFLRIGAEVVAFGWHGLGDRQREIAAGLPVFGQGVHNASLGKRGQCEGDQRANSCLHNFSLGNHCRAAFQAAMTPIRGGILFCGQSLTATTSTAKPASMPGRPSNKTSDPAEAAKNSGRSLRTWAARESNSG